MTDDEIKQIVEGIEKMHGTRIVCVVASTMIKNSINLVGINADVHRLPKCGTANEVMDAFVEINDWLNRRNRERKDGEK